MPSYQTLLFYFTGLQHWTTVLLYYYTSTRTVLVLQTSGIVYALNTAFYPATGVDAATGVVCFAATGAYAAVDVASDVFSAAFNIFMGATGFTTYKLIPVLYVRCTLRI